MNQRIPLHEWTAPEGAFLSHINQKSKQELPPTENLTTWIFEDGTFDSSESSAEAIQKFKNICPGKAVHSLSGKGYKALPLRRVLVPKNNGEKRPLPIPTIRDRAMQTLYRT